MTQPLPQATEQLRHSYVYYLIFPPETAPLYRACCIPISFLGIWTGIGFAVLFTLGWASRVPTWFFAIGLLVAAANVAFAVLSLIATRRSETLDRSTVFCVAAGNYSALALIAYCAIVFWPLWLAIMFWTPMFILFHRQGLRLLNESNNQ